MGDWKTNKCGNQCEFGQTKTSFEVNRSFAQLLSGLETGHPNAVRPPPAYDFSVFDEQKAVLLVSVLDCSECDSLGLNHLNSSWSIARLREYFRRKIGTVERQESRVS